MLVKRRRAWELDPKAATPEAVHRDRRAILAALGFGVAGAALARSLGAATEGEPAAAEPATAAPQPAAAPSTQGAAAPGYPAARNPAFVLDRPLTDEALAAHHNIFDEFGSTKEEIVRAAAGFRTDPCKIHVGGVVKSQRTFEVAELVGELGLEERLYRHRCVEAWAMAVPWTGFPLAKLLGLFERLPDRGKFVRFVSAAKPDEMPGWYSSRRVFPYYEALTLEEATNELAFVATGIYGHPLPPQHGAPIRLVLPWKYGFKSAKSIVKIRFLSDQPKTSWEKSAPNEYGFYSNVNPTVDHPRWSQATERRIGEFRRRKTLPFNGYADQVASLYAGMDLRKQF
jgi:sulfoxide reductase catalytic subunit YedY